MYASRTIRCRILSNPDAFSAIFFIHLLFISEPEIVPPNFRMKQFIATDSLIVTWDAIPIEMHNGVFQGYKLHYAMVRSAGRDLVPKGTTNVISTDKFTFFYEIRGLQSYSTYEITISGFTSAGEGPKSEALKAGMHCICQFILIRIIIVIVKLFHVGAKTWLFHNKIY